MAVKNLPQGSTMISTKAAWDSFPSQQPVETELSEVQGCPLRGLADRGGVLHRASELSGARQSDRVCSRIVG